ncbi:MAG: choice-of-anchor D domain-containing protein, partial [Acidobacteria bacterium]|nr:choice-of-anchor D domain-containing protein [Acidobacteriota bacterium]
MKRLRNKYTLLVGALLLTASSLIGWQVTKADWVHRLFDRADVSLIKARPGPAPAGIQTREKRLVGERTVFKREAELAVGEGTLTSQPVTSVLTDLNEDGQLDLVTAYGNSLVTVQAGQAKGAFESPVPFSVDAQVSAMAAGDFNGDGHMDVLLADATAKSLLVLIGDGRGGLPQAQRVSLKDAPNRLVVKDFLGDQRAEVLVTVSTSTQTEVLLWQDIAWLKPRTEAASKATGRRTLAQSPISLAVPFRGEVTGLEVGYVDSDSYGDIVVIGQQQISVLFGNRTAPFQRNTTVALESIALDSVVGDFNGDVRADVAVLDSSTHDVLIYASDVKGQWGVRQRLNVGATASRLAVADVNGDRVDDLIVMRPEAKEVAAYLGSREGRFGGELVSAITGEPALAVPAYLDSDEFVDLVVVKQKGVSLLLTTESTQQAAQGDNPIIDINPLVLDVRVPEGQCVTVPVTITIAPTVFRPMDIFLLLDTTAGNDFRANSEQFVEDLFNLRGDIRLGIGMFGDFPIAPFGEPGDVAFQRLLDLTPVDVANRSQFLTTLGSIQSRGGGDDLDAQLVALFQAATGAGQQFTDPALMGASIPPNQQAGFRRDIDVEKIIVLVTSSPFHQAGDPGNPGSISFPGPNFAETINALNARGIKVVTVATGGPGGDADVTINALRQIAQATNSLAFRSIDCNGDGIVDIQPGEPIVCGPSPTVVVRNLVLGQVRGFDVPVPLTLEIDRDCSPITFMIEPPVQFVDPMMGGMFVFNITFCAPCPSVPCECRFETKVILDEVIRARIPSRVICTRPVCEVTPATLDFGDVCVGQTGTQMLTVRNTGNGDFTLTAINSTNPAFTVTSPALPVMVPAGGSVTVTVQLTCMAPGPESGTLNLITNPTSTCNSTVPLCPPVPVSGFCVQISGEVTPRSLDFGEVCVGQSAGRTFTVSNTGNRPFTVTGINSSNAAFSIVSPTLPFTLNPGETATVTVRLTCTTPGTQSGTISFVTSSFCGPFDLGTVSLTGFCVQISGEVTPQSIDFGDVCVGTTADQTFTVSNTGNRPFTITAINSNNAAFTIVGPALPITINPGETATVTVRLTCTTPGPQTGTISFTTDSFCGPFNLGTVSLSGFCVQISGEVTPRMID